MIHEPDEGAIEFLHESMNKYSQMQTDNMITTPCPWKPIGETIKYQSNYIRGGA